jgi:Fis family transcriptional regulator
MEKNEATLLLGNMFLGTVKGSLMLRTFVIILIVWDPPMSKDAPSKNSLHNHIRKALHDYFSTLDGASPSGIYNLVIDQVEAPLVHMIMEMTKGNQSLAAKWLGLNRGTLRKLLEKHGT